jgi:hypothetical protein
MGLWMNFAVEADFAGSARSRRDSGRRYSFVVRLTATESSTCIWKKSLIESISDLKL